MLSRVKARLTYANVMVTVLACIVLTGGGAVALGGQNSATVTAGSWHVVGTQGQPVFHATPECRWQNYDTVHSNAAFVRDSAGFVHVKGTVVGIDRTSEGSCHGFSADTNEVIFILPAGYRPAKRESMAALRGSSSGPNVTDLAVVGTVVFDGPSVSSLPAGAVSVDEHELGGNEYFTLDGMSFRCAPSGHNGCP